jgi:hypothetical protein
MAKRKSDKAQLKSTKRTSAPKKAKGLGDTVEKVFEKTGVAKVAKWLLGEDCGCDARRDKLNELFPYAKPNCLLEDEYNYLTWYFGENRNSINPSIQKELLKIYNRVFNEKKSGTNCTPCFVNGILNKLRKLHTEYAESNTES